MLIDMIARGQRQLPRRSLASLTTRPDWPPTSLPQAREKPVVPAMSGILRHVSLDAMFAHSGNVLLVAVWRWVRWLPAMLIVASIGYLLFMLNLGGMSKVRAWYMLQFIPPALSAVSLILCAICGLTCRRFTRVATATAITAIVGALPAIQMVMPVIAYPASIEAMAPAAVVRLPANVPLMVLWGGDDLAHNHHAAVPDQRWAYDLAVAPHPRDSRHLDDYGCYGVEVVAPATGTVIDAHDGEPDEAPGEITRNARTPEGNRVVMRLSTGTYLVIAHLKSKSLMVQIGDLVTEGDAIGRCGNSGNTSEPHIHIHHQRQNPLEYPHGIAEGLPLFFRSHTGEAMPKGGFRYERGAYIPSGATVQHVGG